MKTYQCGNGILSVAGDDGVARRLHPPKKMIFLPSQGVGTFPGWNLVTAFVILLDYFGDTAQAALWCRDFKREVLALDSSWAFTVDEYVIRDWLAEKMLETDLE